MTCDAGSRGPLCQRGCSVGGRVGASGPDVRRHWSRLRIVVMVFVASTCTTSPDQAELVAELLKEYGDHYREHLDWADGAMRIDPSVTMSEATGVVRPATRDLETVVRGAIERTGVPTGDWEQARRCAAFNASLGVPDVITEVVAGRKRAPEGCGPGTGAVFLVGLDVTADSLRMFGRGNGREGHLSFTAVIARDGSGAQIVETMSMWTR